MGLMNQIGLKVAAGVAAVLLALFTALGIYTITLLPSLPDMEAIRDVRLKVPLRVYTAEGSLIGVFGEERRDPITINQAPRTLIDAVLAAEDNAFYSHPGVDMMGVVRAVVANLKSGSSRQGASTITMQVARNYFLSREKTYTRKLKEALLAFRLEQALTKDEILTLYLNKVFLGHRAYGFSAASQVYYGKHLDELDISQYAMLAGLPKAPSRDNPLTNPQRAERRRNYVLGRMQDLKQVTEEQYTAASSAPITASRHALTMDIEAPYVAEMVRAQMVGQYGDDAYWRGFKVYTTIKDEYQKAANHSLRKGLIAYDRRHGYRGAKTKFDLAQIGEMADLDQTFKQTPRSGEFVPAVVIAIKANKATLYTANSETLDLDLAAVKWARAYISPTERGPTPRAINSLLKPGEVVYLRPNLDPEQTGKWLLAQIPEISGALVSLNPNDGALLALTGGFDFYLSKYNRVKQARRQPGSNIKPFIYSAALDNGYTPASMVSGAPIVIEDAARGTVWRPKNYSGEFSGLTPLRRALYKSMNLVSVRILRAIGIKPALEHLQLFGFDRKRLVNGLSLALGAGAVTPMEMVSAYAVLANGGYRIQPYWITRVEDDQGNVIDQPAPWVVCRQCPQPEDVKLALKEYENNSDQQSDEPQTKVAVRVLSSENHFLITDMMRDVIRRGTGRKAQSLDRSDLAGKTGTTNDFRDAWFSGFNRQVVTSVWMGFDQSQTLGRGEAGSKAALPIWIDFMRTALEGQRQHFFRQPETVVSHWIDPESGEQVPESFPGARQEYFMRNQPVVPESEISGSPTPIPVPPAVNGSPVDENLF